MTYAMLFPGQGSQSVGMLQSLPYPEIRQTFEAASDALGWDLTGLVRDGPETQLNQTARTQPALLAAGIALWRVWQQASPPAPAALAGHSLGEYTALVAAGALDFADALRLVALRGELMQNAVPEGEGGMIAVIGLDDAAVEALCADCPVDAVLSPVNYNAPGQVVVAGAQTALAWLEANGKAAGARMLVRLPVSVPSHCALMRGAAERLAERLAETAIGACHIPVIHNVDGRPRSDAAAVREALAAQLYQPVRWTASIGHLRDIGIQRYIECGPGKVLAGLNKRIVKGVDVYALEEQGALDAARAAIGVATA
ncbi:ACP S-malonyltransferase [Flagellatimonas centrodinii]|uniref:ACP S-malonyltransferase n=1 Tax=Flagellatimonas centrodinii TaxID=2806210 RepID=UPI00344C4ADE